MSRADLAGAERPSAHPFDGTAATYDRTFTDTRLGRWLRDQVQRRLKRCFAAGDRVLELGCGTGEDALWLAARGVEVTALDASEAMLEVAQRKAAQRPSGDPVRFLHWPLASDGPVDLPMPDGGVYDGAFSSFGALNCLADLQPLGTALAGYLRPGARLVLVIMGPVCPWEIAGFLLRGRPDQAFRRWRSGASASVGGETLPVWYPSPGALRRQLSPAFRHRRTVGVGVVLPPSHLSALVERHPRFFRLAARLDPLAGAVWPGHLLADHYLAIFERVAS